VGAAGLLTALLLLIFAAAVTGSTTSLAPGDVAPDFELTTYDGEPLRLHDLRGKVVVLNFWASWCVECELEAGTLEALWQSRGPQDVVVIGVAYMDTQPASRRFLEEWGITYPNAPDMGGRVSRAYRLTGVPETVVIDRDGRLAPLALAGQQEPAAKLVGPVVEGGQLSGPQLQALVDQLTGAP
jgi:cytochrome c biogenesis protein CcmG/thiol:disulfide interchange protein DsbE